MWKSISFVLLYLTGTLAIKFGEPRVNLNETVTLKCPVDGTFLWLLPDLTGLDERTNGEHPNRYLVQSENNTLTISGIELADEGTYTCVARLPSNRIQSFFVRLRVIPSLYEGNAWTHYEQSFIIGFVAAGTVFFIVAFLYLIAKFRWRAPLARKQEPRDLYPPEVPSASHKL